MKVLSKIEGIVVTIVLGVILGATSIIGMYVLLYDGMDMYSDQASWITLLYAIAVLYWVIKKATFRVIRIVKDK